MQSLEDLKEQVCDFFCRIPLKDLEEQACDFGAKGSEMEQSEEQVCNFEKNSF
jgi:hypothetical protein